MMTFATVIVVALRSEWQILRRHYRFSQRDPNFPLFVFAENPTRAVLQIGIGPVMAHATLTKFFNIASTKQIFHWGLSGSLTEALPAGELFWPNEICDSQGRTLSIPTLPPLSPAQTGCLLSVVEPLLTVMQKTTAAQTSQALTVDMESYAVAEFCHKHDVQYTSCRGIIDTRNEDISVFAGTQTLAGHTKFLRLFANVLRQPLSIVLLLKFAKRHNMLQRKFLEYLRPHILHNP